MKVTRLLKFKLYLVRISVFDNMYCKKMTYAILYFQLNVSDGRNAKFVESVIPVRDLYAFTCEDKDDMNKFLQEVREKLNLRVNVVHSGAEQQPLSAYKPSVQLSELRCVEIIIMKL